MVDHVHVMRLELSYLDFPPLFQWQIDLLPQLAPLAEMIAQTHIRQTRLVSTHHAIKLTDNILQPQRLPCSLRSPRLKLNMHNMNMEVVIRRLIMHIQLQLISLQLRIQFHRSIQHFLAHMPHPVHLALLQVAHAPDIAPLDDAQQMQRRERLAVPVQIGKEQEALRGVRLTVDDVFLLFQPVEDVVDPLQRTYEVYSSGVSCTIRRPCLVYFLMCLAVQG
jgi:hypothetical protein